MIPKVVEVRPLEGYRLWLRFDDGTSGTVDMSAELWGPMFEPLKDKTLFAQATIHRSSKPSHGPTAPTLRRSSSTSKPPNPTLQRRRRKRRPVDHEKAELR